MRSIFVIIFAVSCLCCIEVEKKVSDSDSLRSALKSGSPGTVISLEKGFYRGPFVAEGNGINGCPIRLEGAENGESSILSAKESDIVITFKNTKFWVVSRIEIEGGDIGVKVDGNSDMEFDTVTVHGTARHGWWITHSSGNWFRRMQVYDTGQLYSTIGAGFRIGTISSEGDDDCSNNKFIHIRVGPGIKAPGFEMLEGSKDSLIQDSVFDQIPFFLHFRGDGWTVTSSRFRGLRSREVIESIQFESVKGFGGNNKIEKSIIDIEGADSSDYCAHMNAKAKKKNNQVCSSNTFKGYKVSPADVELAGC